MVKAKIFNNGRSQAVRIPKEFRFSAEEVFINKIGDTVMLTPIESLAEAFDRGAAMLTDDFMSEMMPSEIASKRETL